MKTNKIIANSKPIGFFSGLILFILLLIFPISSQHPTESLMAAVAVLMIIWWITEALPLGVTSLVPIVAMPFLGLIAGNDIAREYFNSTILIFLGGFLIALSMQKWMLHKRISLIIIKLLGTSNTGIVLGFMTASAVLSMFISNVATTVMLLPIGMAFIYELEEEYGAPAVKTFAVSIMLGIAYASSIGGIGTLIGTAPNLIFQRVYEMSFPELPKITFANWLIFGLPVTITMLFFTWFLLSKVLFKPHTALQIDRKIIQEQLLKLGKISYEEKIVLFVFLTTVLLWLFRTPIDLDFIVISGWSELMPNQGFIDDGTVAILSGLILFILPSKFKDNNKRSKLLDIDVLAKVPWEVILIFGGGFALAKGFTDSGLSILIGNNINNIHDLPPFVMIASISTSLTFLTEMTSNTATTNAILPLLASISKSNNINPLILMLPATLSASFAFMLPVGTPPNAIVYGSGKILIADMIKAGIILNITGILIISIYMIIVINYLAFI
ncbi:MAG: SLC13/DASS family transporter [Candidatus Kapabacteria bacterium]|nr:SLC13/DASS family transporter [Ignavibacteriota bacterium]MCW5883653.1 SLC13/DASS family transporter [Candidatus Kapabacteria bacterium]